jgi:hypothetical protein
VFKIKLNLKFSSCESFVPSFEVPNWHVFGRFIDNCTHKISTHIYASYLSHLGARSVSLNDSCEELSLGKLVAGVKWSTIFSCGLSDLSSLAFAVVFNFPEGQYHFSCRNKWNWGFWHLDVNSFSSIVISKELRFCPSLIPF